jgi:glycolate oxidase
MSLLLELASVVADTIGDRDVLERYRFDQALWGRPGVPLAVVRPTSTEEVVVLARWSARRGIPLVPRGAGTGLSGGAAAIDGAVVVSFERMTKIVEIDAAAQLAVVQPGVLNGVLKDAAREIGLWYPPDPSSYDISTIGGNVATNAGGLCCLKYGVTGDYVLGLELVLADGTVVRAGGRTRKDVAGLDLARLVVGSEGTLAMVTEITLRLRRRPPPVTTMVATFDSLVATGVAVDAIMRVADPSLLELMDRTTLRAVEAYRRIGLDTAAAAMLLVQHDTRGTSELAAIELACTAAGATLVVTTEDEAEGLQLLAARRLALTAVERLGAVLVDDVAVPVPRLPEMMQRIERVAEGTTSTIATIAHAGDGNLHPLVIYDPKAPGAEETAVAAFETIMVHALELGGTITGEHGIGTLKRSALSRQLSPASLALQRRIKAAFDPRGLLNPGKVFGP